jgi:aryl-alcohol dehydrogenase-like predicted oxidoreductase
MSDDRVDAKDAFGKDAFGKHAFGNDAFRNSALAGQAFGAGDARKGRDRPGPARSLGRIPVPGPANLPDTRARAMNGWVRATGIVMKKHGSSRREFLQASAGTVAASMAAWSAARAASTSRQEPPGSHERSRQGPPGSLERRKFGKTDMQVAVLGFGGAEIGFENVGQGTVDELLNAALDAGMNVIDTAECYRESEVLIGKAVGHRRKDYYLFTKCGHFSESGKGEDWSKAAILRSVERSLGRLKTDAVDLVQLHSCPLEELRKGECIEALEQAKKEGKTRFIGYSGDSKAARYAVECGRFDALQTSVNIVDQECIELTLPLAKEKGMGVIAKRPIANAVWRHPSRPGNDYHVEYWNRLQKLGYDFAKGENSEKAGVDGPAAIAMRFTAMQPGVSVLIVGTTKPDRWKENAELIRAGPLPKELEASIRARWKEVAESDWIGQT